MFNSSRSFISGFVLIFACVALSTNVVFSQVEVEIIADEGAKIPITIVPFDGDSELGLTVAEIITNDLLKTGIFASRSVEVSWGGRSKLAPDEYGIWTDRGTQNLVLGQFERGQDGRIEVSFRLYDIPGQQQTIGFKVKDDPRQLRQVAHYFADLIYEKLTGEPGVFRTKLTYVVRSKERSSLVIADSDGHNAREIFGTAEPILSPRWSPNGKHIAFVSFMNRKAAVYVVSVDPKSGRALGEPEIIGPYRGSNSAPAWSKDGNSLALSVSQNGRSDIYLVSMVDRAFRPLTNHQSINTEPTFSSDGESVIFTSDRTGRPNIYSIPVSGGKELRLTYSGRYNASAKSSHDGDFLVLIHNDGAGFNVATHDLKSGVTQILTNGALDQSPSIAPNGRIIVYASEQSGRGILRFVSKNGRSKARYSGSFGELREPSWGPLIND